ncbi:MAG: hypothetical protein QW514_09285 [Thermoprotei archaeon]
MIDTLITYVPFYRVHEIKKYFAQNMANLKPNRSIVYVDNVFEEAQKNMLEQIFPNGVQLRTGNWKDRNLCFIQILKDMKSESSNALVVDSDNILEQGFRELDDALSKAGYSYYTVLDYECTTLKKFLSRSILLSKLELWGSKISVYGYRVIGTWKGIFFLGPKQAVKLDRQLLEKLDTHVIVDVENSLLKIEPDVRYHITDETTLGLIYYYSGIDVVPWVIFSHHQRHDLSKTIDLRTRRMLNATARAQFARGMLKRKYGRMYWFYIRYKLSQIIYNLLVIIAR